MVLENHKARYLKCNHCGFIQVEDPFWLSEAYESAVPDADIGHVARCFLNAEITKSIIELLFSTRKKFVDFGGGYGLLVRHMRDLGYDYYRQDKYCENIFSKNFEANSESSPSYELVTAFEVVEHLPNPHEGFSEILSLSRNILFTTELLPDPAPQLNEWWYYGSEHGQHLSFYTHRSLEELAHFYGLHFSSVGNIHLFTEKSVQKLVFKIATNPSFYKNIAIFKKRKSLLMSDWENMRKQPALGKR